MSEAQRLSKRLDTEPEWQNGSIEPWLGEVLSQAAAELRRLEAECEQLRQALAAHEAAKPAEPVCYEFRQVSGEGEWRRVEPRDRLGSVEETLADIRAYRYGGKPAYEVRALYAAPAHEAAKPAEPVAFASVMQVIEKAFYDGFHSRETYNDTVLNDPKQEWESNRAGYARTLAAPVAVASPRKFTQATVRRKFEDGIQAQGWMVVGRGGNWTAAMKPLMQYLNGKEKP